MLRKYLFILFKIIITVFLSIQIVISTIYVLSNIYNINFYFFLSIIRCILSFFILLNIWQYYNLKSNIYKSDTFKGITLIIKEIELDYFTLNKLYPENIIKTLNILNILKTILGLIIMCLLVFNIIIYQEILINNYIKFFICFLSLILVSEVYLEYKYIISKLYTLFPWEGFSWVFNKINNLVNANVTSDTNIKINNITNKLDIVADKVDLTTEKIEDLSKKVEELRIKDPIDQLGLKNKKIVTGLRTGHVIGKGFFGTLMCIAGTCWIMQEILPDIKKTPCTIIGDQFKHKIPEEYFTPKSKGGDEPPELKE